jgi:hypothetical protein
MYVPKIDYGVFRLLGLQTNHQDSYALMFGDTVPLLPSVAITLSNLELYNGQQLFLQETFQEINADTFSILPTSTTRANSGLLWNFETPYNYQRRRSRFFSGLRDTPVIQSNVEVLVTVNAFISTPVIPPAFAPPVGPPLEIPFTANLIVDILEDATFGNVRNPSAVSRAGATVQLSTRDIGITPSGREQVEVVSPHYRRPRER